MEFDTLILHVSVGDYIGYHTMLLHFLEYFLSPLQLIAILTAIDQGAVGYSSFQNKRYGS